jgi:hypothetical protein
MSLYGAARNLSQHVGLDIKPETRQKLRRASKLTHLCLPRMTQAICS